MVVSVCMIRVYVGMEGRELLTSNIQLTSLRPTPLQGVFTLNLTQIVRNLCLR